MRLRGIILHGGKGTRLRPLTHTGPKQLIPVANKPISQYALEDLKEAGVNEVAIVLGEITPEKVVKYYGDGERFGLKITYVRQGVPKGIAHAVGLSRDFVGDEPFIVYLGDNILRGGIRRFAEDFVDKGYDAMVLLCEVEKPQRFGVAEFDGDRLVRLVEKPKTPPSKYALVGIYFFGPRIFDAIEALKPSWRGELEITEAVQKLLDWGLNVGYRRTTGWWKDTGRPEDVLEANQFVLSEIQPFNKGSVEDDVSISGRVGIGRGTVILRGSTVRGPVVIGGNCQIGPNTYVGPYTSIGDNVIIRGGEIENTIVIGDTLIECNKRIRDSLIGRNSRIVSADKGVPRGYKLIIGESTFVSL